MNDTSYRYLRRMAYQYADVVTPQLGDLPAFFANREGFPFLMGSVNRLFGHQHTINIPEECFEDCKKALVVFAKRAADPDVYFKMFNYCKNHPEWLKSLDLTNRKANEKTKDLPE